MPYPPTPLRWHRRKIFPALHVNLLTIAFCRYFHDISFRDKMATQIRYNATTNRSPALSPVNSTSIAPSGYKFRLSRQAAQLSFKTRPRYPYPADNVFPGR